MQLIELTIAFAIVSVFYAEYNSTVNEAMEIENAFRELVEELSREPNIRGTFRSP